MLQFTDQNLQIHQAARDRKAHQLRLGRKYLEKARLLGLPVDSTTVRYWTAYVANWRDTSVYVIVADIERRDTRGLHIHTA